MKIEAENRSCCSRTRSANIKPSKTLIKICGLMKPADVDAVNAAQPDAAGFILSQGFRRSISLSQACDLIGQLDPSIMPVGVFVNEPIENVACFAHAFNSPESGIPRKIMVQLHGDEDDAYIKKLRSAMAYPGWQGIPLMKAFTVRTHADVQQACSTTADYVLLDNGKGTGETFDWLLLQNMKRKYFLAGGLNPGNVAKAILQLHPYAVDMSSGVETNGHKDPDKIMQAVKAVRTSSEQQRRQATDTTAIKDE